MEVRLQHQPGGPWVTRYLDFVYQPILDASGASTAIFVEGADVTDKVQAENELRSLNTHLEARIAARTRDLEDALQRLQDESRERQAAEDALRQAQKMEAVGQLTGGIAHDFNNLLQGITGSLDLLKLRLQLGRLDNLDKLIAGAMNSAQRAAGLTHRLLAFSRRQTLDPKPVKANQLIAPMEELLRRTLGEKIRLELVLSGGLWTTLCDPHQLESAILNLCINARDAMPDGGRLTIETSNAWLDDAYVAQHADLQPGQYVCICVSDTGVGMPPDVLAKAFDPFFTTKPIGQGTGLGLSMIYGFCKQSSGHAKLYSEPGQGTTARLYLPRHHGEASAPPEPPQLGEAHQSLKGEVVLVVEDEAVVRALVIEVLVGLGYRTLEAADGGAALRILESKQRIDLLVTDVGLPVMNGRQVYDAAAQTRPGLKVLFMTGYAENAALGNGFLAPGMELITKPFSMEKLASQISRILGRGER
jgi:signal transduction histidine kinase